MMGTVVDMADFAAFSTFGPWHGGRPVPWTTVWTGEEQGFHVGTDHYAPGHMLLRQREAPGEGTPIFTSVHMQRQRAAMIQGRCDLCGKAIRRGQARVVLAEPERLKGTDIEGHVMAPLHRECARIGALLCPWTQGRIEAGRLVVTVVVRSTIAMAMLDPDMVEAETGRRFDGPVYGHAKLIVRKGLTRDAGWLLGAREAA